MKKNTLITGYLTAFIFLIGVIFKVQHYPGAGVLIIFSCIIFSLGYGLPLFFEKNSFATNSNQQFINFLVLILMILIPTGFLFKIQHWPGAGVLIYLGNILLIIGIPLLIMNAVKSDDIQKKLNYHNEAILFIFLTAFSIFMLFARNDKNILNAFVPIGNNVITEMKFHETKSNELFIVLVNTVNANNAGKIYLDKAKAVKTASDTFNKYITDLEKLLITTTEQTDGNPDSLETIKAKDDYSAVNNVLFKELLKAKELKQKLITYKELVGQNTNSRGKQIIDLFFNTDDPETVEGDSLTWEAVKFDKLPLVSVLLTLNQTRANIRMLEAETMTYLQAVAATVKSVPNEALKKPEKKVTNTKKVTTTKKATTTKKTTKKATTAKKTTKKK
jgi:hypothetical protein